MQHGFFRSVFYLFYLSRTAIVVSLQVIPHSYVDDTVYRWNQQLHLFSVSILEKANLTLIDVRNAIDTDEQSIICYFMDKKNKFKCVEQNIQPNNYLKYFKPFKNHIKSVLI